jgi:FtsP/CotA-like multicopper oxidase with cupredoxin domain
MPQRDRVSKPGLSLTRRRLLASGVGLGAAVLLPSQVNQNAEGSTVWPNAGGRFQAYCPIPLARAVSQTIDPAKDSPPFIEPESRRSTNGVLQTSLRCAYAYHNVGGYQLFLRTYEGSTPGPTLRLQPGETMRIKLINDMPPNRDDEPANLNHPHHFNTTNFHFHGSHVSPKGISDNVLREMEPGQSYDIEIVLPNDHTRGSYWYHPHHHGSADMQVVSGMAGMIVVEGDFADVPEIANAKERVMVLGESSFDAFGMVEDFSTIFQEGSTRFLTINGQRYPTIEMRPGEVQRWRILHAGYQDDLALVLDGHDLNVIAWDGITQSSMTTPQGSLVIVPGQRVDVLVKAAQPGSYELKAVPYDQGYISPNGPLARVVVSGDPTPMSLPSSLPAAPLAPIRDSEITNKRQVVFSAIAPEAPQTASWMEFSFLIDGKKFDASRVDHSIKLGAVEEWTLVNLHEHDHVFHIHQNPFQVTAINGKPVTDLRWRDTDILPGSGTMTFRSRFLDFTGKYVLHCHMMNHEDMGMMQLIEVS